MSTGKELGEVAAGAAGSMAMEKFLEMLESSDNEQLREFLDSLGLDSTTVFLITTLAGYGGKRTLRLAIKIYSDPAAREKAKRIGLGTLRAFGRAFGPDNRAGSLGQDWLFFSEKD